MSDAGNIVLGDSGSSSNDRIQIGSSQDLSLFHNGTHSFINNSQGTLVLQSDALSITNEAGNSNRIVAASTGNVFLYFSDSVKLKTTGSGVDITDTLNVARVSTFTTVTTSGSITVNTAANGLPALFLTHSNSGADDWKIMAGITGVSNSGFSIYDVDSTTSRFIIDTNGNVGINNTAPVEKLGISGNMRFINPNDNTSRISALYSGSYNLGSSGGSAIAFHRVTDGVGGSDEIAFETHWQGNRHGEAARFNKYGNLAFPTNQGIDFSADGSAAGMNSELLHDYEEGTWTPIVQWSSGTGVAGASNAGFYVKIGCLV